MDVYVWQQHTCAAPSCNCGACMANGRRASSRLMMVQAPEAPPKAAPQVSIVFVVRFPD